MDFEKLEELLSEKNYPLLKSELKSLEPVDIAEYIDDLEEKKALIVFRLLPKEKAADVFSYLSTDKQLEISDLINEKELAAIISDLYFDDKVDLLEEMPANAVKKILQNTTAVERKLINQFLMYPENSAGSLMTIEFVDLKKEMTVGEALERIRRSAPDKITIYTCYVTDGKRYLEGTVSLKDLVLAKTETRIEDIIRKDAISVNTHDDQEEIADIFKRYDLLALPVVDNENRLVGIITVDDIVDVIEQENTEDFHKMAAIEPIDEEYINVGVFKLARKRILWLVALMISATFTGYIIQSFEDVLQSVVALAAFIPMLMNTGGNAGAQVSALVIRSIVLGEVTFGDLFRIIWKEARISMVVGSGLAVFNFLRIYFLERYPLTIALTVSLTLIFTVITAKIMGGILPLLAKKLKLDPAVMASPMITTIVDAVSLIIYFSFATWLLDVNA